MTELVEAVFHFKFVQDMIDIKYFKLYIDNFNFLRYYNSARS